MDTLAKEGTAKEQDDRSNKSRPPSRQGLDSKWLLHLQHPYYNRSDPYHMLSGSQEDYYLQAAHSPQPSEPPPLYQA